MGMAHLKPKEVLHCMPQIHTIREHDTEDKNRFDSSKT